MFEIIRRIYESFFPKKIIPEIPSNDVASIDVKNIKPDTCEFGILGYRSAGNAIIVLEIYQMTSIYPKNQIVDRNHATFKTNYAMVHDIYDKDTREKVAEVASDWDPTIYTVGKVVTDSITFYLTEEPAYQNNKSISSGFSKQWYDTGQLKYEYDFSNKTEKHWYLDGRLKYESDQNLRKEWYRDGRLMSESNYKNGWKHGTAKKWRSNGELKSYLSFVNGRQHGLQWIWHKNGELTESEYLSGLKCREKRYNEHGRLKSDIPYPDTDAITNIDTKIENTKPKKTVRFMIP